MKHCFLAIVALVLSFGAAQAQTQKDLNKVYFHFVKGDNLVDGTSCHLEIQATAEFWGQDYEDVPYNQYGYNINNTFVYYFEDLANFHGRIDVTGNRAYGSLVFDEDVPANSDDIHLYVDVTSCTPNVPQP